MLRCMVAAGVGRKVNSVTPTDVGIVAAELFTDLSF